MRLGAVASISDWAYCIHSVSYSSLPHYKPNFNLTHLYRPSPPGNYLSYILRRLGYSTFEANMLAIPSQFLFAVQLLLITWLSKKARERSIVASLSNIWILPWLIALVAIPASLSSWVRYALLSGLLSYPYCHAILVGWNAQNSNSVRTRAVSAAFYNCFVQVSQVFR